MMPDAAVPSPRASSGLLPAGVAERIEAYLRQHFSEPAAALLAEALERGHVVHASMHAPGVIAYRQGILFVAGTEYVICDE